MLQEFVEAGAHDRIVDRKNAEGGGWAQWMTPDFAKRVAISNNAHAAAERYRTEPAVRLDQARRYRERTDRRRGMREKLAKTREGLTLHFTIITKAPPKAQGAAPEAVEVDGYVITGVYEDGRLGEFFVRVSKEIAALGPMIDQWAISCSMALQYGAPVDVLLGKFVATRFEPSGPVQGCGEIKRCTSPVDLIARWLLSKYTQAVKLEEDVSLLDDPHTTLPVGS